MTIQTLEQMIATRAKATVQERYDDFRKDIRRALQQVDCAPQGFTEADPTFSERAQLLLAGLGDGVRDKALAALAEHEVVRMRRELLDAVGRVDEILRGNQ